MVFSPLTRGPGYGVCPKRPRAPTKWTSVLPLAGIFALAAVGCDDDEDSVSTPGELGSHHFFYECSTVDDVQCRNELTSFPDVVAVGASFDLVTGRNFGSSLFIKPASPSMVSSGGGEFRFLRPGVAAFLALSQDDKLKDFVHLTALPVDEIEVENTFGQSVTQVALNVGRTATLTAVPFGQDSELAGSMSFRWVTDNESVVAVPRRGTEIKIEGRAQGTALVRVELDDVSTTIQVTVGPTPIDAVDADVDRSDAGDAGVLDGALDASDIGDAGADGSASIDASATADTSTSDASTNAGATTDASTLGDAASTTDAQVPTEAGAP